MKTTKRPAMHPDEMAIEALLSLLDPTGRIDLGATLYGFPSYWLKTWPVSPSPSQIERRIYWLQEAFNSPGRADEPDARFIPKSEQDRADGHYVEFFTGMGWFEQLCKPLEQDRKDSEPPKPDLPPYYPYQLLDRAVFENETYRKIFEEGFHKHNLVEICAGLSRKTIDALKASPFSRPTRIIINDAHKENVEKSRSAYRDDIRYSPKNLFSAAGDFWSEKTWEAKIKASSWAFFNGNYLDALRADTEAETTVLTSGVTANDFDIAKYLKWKADNFKPGTRFYESVDHTCDPAALAVPYGNHIMKQWTLNGVTHRIWKKEKFPLFDPCRIGAGATIEGGKDRATIDLHVFPKKYPDMKFYLTPINKISEGLFRDELDKAGLEVFAYMPSAHPDYPGIRHVFWGYCHKGFARQLAQGA